MSQYEFNVHLFCIYYLSFRALHCLIRYSDSQRGSPGRKSTEFPVRYYYIAFFAAQCYSK